MTDKKIQNLIKMKLDEEFKSKAYFNAYYELKDVDTELASKLYNLHEIHYYNAVECNELLTEANEWIKQCENIIDQLEV